MNILVTPGDRRRTLGIGSAEFVANPFPSDQTIDFIPLGNGCRLQPTGSAGLAANLFPSSQLTEFIPVGIATSFGEGGKVTLKMLRQLAYMPHVLFFGRLQLLGAPLRGQFIEFIPVTVVTNFREGDTVALEMLVRHVNIPHVICFGRLTSDSLPRQL